MKNILFICALLFACHSEEAQYPDSEDNQSDNQSDSSQEPSDQESNDSPAESAPAPECEDPCMGCEWFPAGTDFGCDGCKAVTPTCH